MKSVYFSAPHALPNGARSGIGSGPIHVPAPVWRIFELTLKLDGGGGRRNSELFQGNVTRLRSKSRQIEDAKTAASQWHEALENRTTIFGAPQTLDILRF